MDSANAGIDAELLGLVDDLLRGAVALGLGDERGKFRIVGSHSGSKRMIRRNRHELGAEQGVGTRGEHVEFGLA